MRPRGRKFRLRQGGLSFFGISCRNPAPTRALEMRIRMREGSGDMRLNRSSQPLLGACLALLWLALPALAAEKDMTDKGQALVEKNCARCHAIGTEGDSPHKEAPPFRTLSNKYPVSDLAESLAERTGSGHPDMPIFVFSPQDVSAIIDYLESIQEKPAAPAGEPH